jgi:hypothetical protein
VRLVLTGLAVAAALASCGEAAAPAPSHLDVGGVRVTPFAIKMTDDYTHDCAIAVGITGSVSLSCNWETAR